MRVRLKEFRKKKGLTIRELSEMSGVSKSHISKIENGESDPTFTVMCKLAAALRENPWDVFSCKDFE
jgi:XRE family transcriptional regulator of biofilm formation